ncbi:MAG: ATP-binding protein, partial [Chloroflexota bacterium]
GVLAAANRGILYVDEVNLLDDHVVDLLLDSAAMGVNVVEREGISFSHPARFILVGTMNPEEGDLRPQLLDRFALSTEVHGITDPTERVVILERHIAFENDPVGFRDAWYDVECELRDRIVAAREIVDEVQYTRGDLRLIALMTSSMQIDGHRADLVILKTARAHAAYHGRRQINREDILLAVELAIPHRLKRGPMADAHVDMDSLADQMRQLESELEEEDESAAEGPETSNKQMEGKKKVSRR